MTRGDQLIERAAGRLDDLARSAAAGGGLKAKLARPLAEDAALVRGMRPGLVAARLRGKPDAEPPAATPPRVEPAPDPRAARPSQGGPSPIALVAAAFVLGLLLAKVVDWRSHAYPRR
ncbi:MAG: hypothetical protein ICV67_02070 [Thermoleophilia bacterium]|nr:hypothetical protein [Thermoleophilia bacterium]